IHSQTSAPRRVRAGAAMPSIAAVLMALHYTYNSHLRPVTLRDIRSASQHRRYKKFERPCGIPSATGDDDRAWESRRLFRRDLAIPEIDRARILLVEHRPIDQPELGEFLRSGRKFLRHVRIGRKHRPQELIGRTIRDLAHHPELRQRAEHLVDEGK